MKNPNYLTVLFLSIVFFWGFSSIPQNIYASGNGLIASYTFDQISGIADVSSNGNNGTLVSGATLGIGKTGNALILNGTGQKMTVPDSPKLSINGSLTLTAWIKPSSLSYSAQTIILKGKSWPSNYVLQLENTSLLWKWAGGDAYHYSSSVIKPNVWQHVAVTFDATTKKVTFYINGVVQGIDSETKIPSSQPGPLSIGGDESGNYFAGSIDEVRIYNRALYSSEVQGDMGLLPPTLGNTSDVPAPSTTSIPLPLPFTPPPTITAPSSATEPLPIGWSQMQNSQLQSMCPPNNFGGSGYNFFDNCTNVVDAWNSAVLDTKRNRLLVWGGGHGAYYGNEFYAVNFNTRNIERINDPGLPTAPRTGELCTGAEAQASGTQASSRHTYDGISYVEDADKLFVIGGAWSATNGCLGNDTWIFDFATMKWERKYPGGDIPRAVPGLISAYDPNTGKVLVHDDWNLYTYDVATNFFTRISTGNPTDYHLIGVIDSIRKKFVLIGGGEAWIYDIGPGSKYLRKPLITSGGSSIINSLYPGLAYDKSTGRIVGWHGGDTVYSLNLDTGVWTPSTYRGGPGAGQPDGTMERFSYIPSLNAFALVNSMKQNVFFLKMNPADNSTNLPPVTPTPPVISPLATTTSPIPLPPPPTAPVLPTVPSVPIGNVITSFTLSSPVSQTLAPFTLGQAFRQGDVPSGLSITANIQNFQATIKTRWPDGSAQFAVLSGRVNMQANTPIKISLTVGTNISSTPPLTEADLVAQGANMKVTFGNFGSVELANLIGRTGSYSSVLNRWSAGKIYDWIAGPEMSSWIYSSPIGNDPILTAWFEVRLWKGGHIEILPWIENGYLLKTGTSEKNGVASISINGTHKWSQNLAVLQHTRTPLVSGTEFSHWIGGDPQITPTIDVKYLQTTKVVPTYMNQISPSKEAFSRLKTSFTPFAQANFPNMIGTAGYDGSIGLLPEWDVLFLTSGGDERAYKSVIVNAYSAGRYGIYYRDEKTNRPIKFSEYPNLVMSGSSGIGSTGGSTVYQYTPAGTGSGVPAWNTSHAPSIGFMAYLLQGRYYFMEETQFASAVIFLKQTDSMRGYTKGILETMTGANTTRGVAWGLRTYLQAYLATPDTDVLKPELSRVLDENISHYYERYVATPNNPQGIVQPYQDFTTTGDNVYVEAIFMNDFLTGAFGYVLDAKAVSASLITKAQSFFAWQAQSIIGRLGRPGVTTEYDFRDAAWYTIPVAPSDSANWTTGTGPWYANWGEIYREKMKTNAGTAETNKLRGSYFPETTGYWGNLQPAISYAVTLGIPGAQDAYARMSGASNWGDFLRTMNDYPVWGVMPSSPLSPSPANVIQTISQSTIPVAQNLPQTTTPLTSALPTVPVISTHFDQNLSYGLSAEDVRLLQQFLNSHGFLVASQGPGSLGSESAFFGQATRNAVIRFQEYYKADILSPFGLNAGTGYVGSGTRNKINDLIK